MTFAAGFAAGYLLGTRAGRQRYEQISRTVGTVRSSPVMQRAASSFEHKAGDVVDNARRSAAEKISDHVPPAVVDRIRPGSPEPVVASATPARGTATATSAAESTGPDAVGT